MKTTTDEGTQQGPIYNWYRLRSFALKKAKYLPQILLKLGTCSRQGLPIVFKDRVKFNRQQWCIGFLIEEDDGKRKFHLSPRTDQEQRG